MNGEVLVKRVWCPSCGRSASKWMLDAPNYVTLPAVLPAEEVRRNMNSAFARKQHCGAEVLIETEPVPASESST